MARCFPVRLEVDRVDHQPVGITSVGRQLGEDPVEHAQAAPAENAVVDRPERAIGGKAQRASAALS